MKSESLIPLFRETADSIVYPSPREQAAGKAIRLAGAVKGRRSVEEWLEAATGGTLVKGVFVSTPRLGRFGSTAQENYRHGHSKLG